MRFEVVKGNSEEVGTLITLKWTGRGRLTPFNPLLFLLRVRIKREATSELIELKILWKPMVLNFLNIFVIAAANHLNITVV